MYVCMFLSYWEVRVRLCVVCTRLMVDSLSDSKSWRVYGRNAEEVKSALLAAHPGLTVILNPEKPRRNSFEVTLLDGGKGKFPSLTGSKLECCEQLSRLQSPQEWQHSQPSVSTWCFYSFIMAGICWHRIYSTFMSYAVLFLFCSSRNVSVDWNKEGATS